MKRLNPAGAVTGITAELVDGKIVVHWQAPADGSHVASYQVYYASRSILENNGEYDDYERADGTNTDFTLETFPRSTGEVYVSVLALDAQGREMDTFTEEAKVTLGGAALPAPATALTLKEAHGTSDTTFTLVFSNPVSLLPADAPKAFHVVDDRGQTLALARLIIQGAEVKITSAAQRPGVTYVVTVEPVITGTGPGGEHLTLDPAHAVATFASVSTTPVPSPTPTTTQTPPQQVAQVTPATGAPGEVRALQMKGEKQSDGRYLVIAVWDPPATRPAVIQIRQTRDGVAYGDAQRVPGDVTSIRFQGVEPGRFGILVQTAGVDGQLSAGAYTSVTLSGTPTRRADLTHSGAGALGVLALSGTAAGWLWMRRRALSAA